MDCFHDKIKLPLPLRSSFPIGASLDAASIRCSLTRISDSDRYTFSLAEGIVKALEELEHRVVRCELTMLLCADASTGTIMEKTADPPPTTNSAPATNSHVGRSYAGCQADPPPLRTPPRLRTVTSEEAMQAAKRFLVRFPSNAHSTIGFLHSDNSPWALAMVNRWGSELLASGGWPALMATAQMLDEVACEEVPNAHWDDKILDVWRAHLL